MGGPPACFLRFLPAVAQEVHLLTYSEEYMNMTHDPMTGAYVSVGKCHRNKIKRAWGQFTLEIKRYIKSSYDHYMAEIRYKFRSKTPISHKYGAYVVSDTPDYCSPVTGKVVSGRAARREEMKVHNVREVDPSEKAKVTGYNGGTDGR